MKRIRTRKAKQEDTSEKGTGFRLGERGIRDVCGQVLKSVQRGEEFFDGEVWWVNGGEENVGDVV